MNYTNRYVIAILSIAALAVAPLKGASVGKITFSPFVQAEAVYSNPGLDATAKNNLNNFDFGGGVTLGGISANGHHEVSVTVRYGEWDSDAVVTPGFAAVTESIEQLPILFNYRYHLPVAGSKVSIFAGPTVGVVRETFSITSANLGALPPAFTGTNSNTEWQLAYGGSIGAAVKIGSKWTVSATAQAIKLGDETVAPAFGTTVNPVVKREVSYSFALAAGYSW